MESVQCLNESRTLIGKWDLYYHLPHDKQWDLSSYKFIAKNISTIDTLISINNNIPEKIVKHCMLFVMKSGITPMWEDKQNRKGGCFSFKVANKLVYDVWTHLFYSLCGETLCIKQEHNKYINGITISPKKNFCIIKVWLTHCKMQNPAQLTEIPGLSIHGCLFKKHKPLY